MEDTLLSSDCRRFLNHLHVEFEDERRSLLQSRLNRNKNLDFLPDTKSIREGNWTVAETPADLQDRRVEITGPAETKMIINALNSGAKVFMADFEDSLSPTWENILLGHAALIKANNRTLEFTNESGKKYSLNPKLATLLVRPRGLHLIEKNYLVEGHSIAGALFDFGVYFFHNAKELIRTHRTPAFYLPKLESHLEARWWNKVFTSAQKYLNIPQGTIRATVLIETIPAAFEMDEILFELKEHAAGLNAGRWDYLFSFIKKHFDRPEFVLPDRAQLTMATPFMAAYAELLVQTCHKRKAHAIGGMAAFIPNRKEAQVTEIALQKVAADKAREAGLGFDGSWVAHPDLIEVAENEFNKVLGSKPHQKEKIPSRKINAKDLLNLDIPGGKITELGVRTNISVSIQYIAKWLGGLGAVAINNLMEDAATAEISRTQLWQWLHHQATLEGGKVFSKDLYQNWKSEEIQKIPKDKLTDVAVKILDDLVLNSKFEDFLTLSAYPKLNHVFNSPPGG